METRRQAKQVLEHLHSKYGIDTVAGVQDQVLPHPCECGSEDHEHYQSDAHHI